MPSWKRTAGSTLLLAFAILGLADCATGVAGVSGDEAKALVQKGATLLDVRSPQEFADGHIPGAINIPLSELSARMGEVGPRERPIVVYCLSGGRSAPAAGLLHEAGFAHVYDLGPMGHWPGR